MRKAQQDFIESLYKYGMALVAGFHHTEEPTNALTSLVKQVAQVRMTTWGETFTVRSQPDGIKKDLAYTSDYIPLHTDNPYRALPPGYQWLYNARNETCGGINYFADGYSVAKLLKPEFFELLHTVPVRFENFDGGCDYASAASAHFQLDYKGDLDIIRWSDKSGGYLLNPNLPSIDKFYEAKFEFSRLLESRDHQIEMKLNDQCCIVVDNHRFLHARTGWDANEGERHVIGCYSDKDDHWNRVIRYQAEQQRGINI